MHGHAGSFVRILHIPCFCIRGAIPLTVRVVLLSFLCCIPIPYRTRTCAATGLRAQVLHQRSKVILSMYLVRRVSNNDKREKISYKPRSGVNQRPALCGDWSVLASNARWFRTSLSRTERPSGPRKIPVATSYPYCANTVEARCPITRVHVTHHFIPRRQLHEYASTSLT